MGVLVRESPCGSVRVSQGGSREQEQLGETCGVRAAGSVPLLDESPKGVNTVLESESRN